MLPLADNQAELNKQLYAKAPTAEDIYSFLNQAEICPRQYERMVGMRPGTLADVKSGYRSLPVKWWALIFNKVIPTYGKIAGFKKPINNNRTNNRKHKPLCVPKHSTNSIILNKLQHLKSD